MNPEPQRLLEGRTLGLLFRSARPEPVSRSRSAAAHLGATAPTCQASSSSWLAASTIEDTARVLGRYLDALAIRTHEHAEVETFAAVAGIPVVNALTDEAHPLQALADLQTIRERFGALEGVRVAWVGDGSERLRLAGGGLRAPRRRVRLRRSGRLRAATIRRSRWSAIPREAAAGAHVLVTDVWVSMGQEDEREQRVRDLAGYSLDAELLGLADRDAIVLHCLPAHPGEEIAADVLYGPRSAVWDEAENRLHTAKAVLALTVAGGPAFATRG